MLQVDNAQQRERQMTRGFRLSLVTPAYNESDNLPLLYERVCAVLTQLDVDWEWIVVDDHSTDDTFETIADISRRDTHVRAMT